MPRADDLRFDAATAISQGRRNRQEDAAIVDFPVGLGMGFAVLADGMGGHAAGDMASKIVVTEVFSELKLQSGDPADLESRISQVLLDAAHGANACIGQYTSQMADSASMGATLLAPVFLGDHLFWISVGDSPLFLMRNHVLTRLNADHAIGSQVEFLVSNGLMQREEVLNYPDQNCLTSVIGGQVITQIDCPSTPVHLKDGDILIAASDGLLTLTEDEIASVISKARPLPASGIGAALLNAVEAIQDPNQDNITVCVIKVRRHAANTLSQPVSRPAAAAGR